MYKSIIIAAALVGTIATASAQTHQISEHHSYDPTAGNYAQQTFITEDGHVNIARRNIGRVAGPTQTYIAVDLVTQEELANHVGQRGQQGLKGDTGERGERGYTGFQGHTGATGAAGRDGIDGINGVDGQDGRNGIDGTNGTNGTDGRNGQDGRDADMSVLGSYIAGNSALSFANAGGDGIGFGAGANEYGTAGAVSVSKSFGNHSFSFGATTSRQVGAGYKFKF